MRRWLAMIALAFAGCQPEPKAPPYRDPIQTIYDTSPAIPVDNEGNREAEEQWQHEKDMRNRLWQKQWHDWYEYYRSIGYTEEESRYLANGSMYRP